MQIGVVSFGSVGCADGTPTVFARVEKYVPWIRENIRP